MKGFAAVFVLVVSGACLATTCPVISEISALTQGPEWIELAEMAGANIDLRAWSLDDGIQSRKLDSTAWLAAHGRLVLSNDCVALRDQFATGSIRCSKPSGWNALAIDQDRIVLRRPTGEVCDSVEWNQKTWGDWLLGRSRERIDLARSSNDPQNWVASSGPRGGTPGWQSARRLEALGASIGIEMVSRRIVPGNLALIVRLRAPWNQKLSAGLYNLARRRVAVVWDGMIPASGELNWDGSVGARSLVPGVYLLLLEFPETSGGVPLRFREWVVVGA